MTTAEHPTARPALDSLRRARELFLTGRQLPDGVPEEIVSAWRRARFLGVRHDVGDAVPERAVRPPESLLLTAARPVLERIAAGLGPGQPALVLTDERLRVLWSTGFARDDLGRPDLSEQAVGHNSAVRALRTRRRAEVHGPEHFLDLWQDVSAVSVPLLAPGTGRILGTVTVASRLCAECGPHPGAPLAEAAASAVEAELLARSRSAERVLLDAYLRAVGEEPGRQGRRAVVALDGRNRLVSEDAARLLSPEGLEALERHTVSLLEAASGVGTEAGGPGSGAGSALAGTGAAADATFQRTRTAADATPQTTRTAADATPQTTRTAADATPQTTRTAADATPQGAGTAARSAPSTSYDIRLPHTAGCSATVTPVLHQGSAIGAVAVLEPVGDAADVSSAGTGGVGLAGRSVPWRHAVARATELARHPGPLLIVGERGTGKTALARELAASPLAADAAEGEIGSWLGQLAQDRALLVRHVERLEQSDTATLNALLETHPDAPLLVTYTPGTPPGPCLQRLLDSLAARSVTLPALRERTEDIRELLTALTPGPVPGQPPLTWTLDALRALERYPWPGNVTELAHVVRTLAETRRATGPVRRAELPDLVREGPARRRLSPMEHAERAAILDALHRNGGNKARTAAALGIARATLYRKLRGYRG
ncbi:helix-turn-helix domain-containing protein [Streptomyces resistomycificus]|uniref:helix-turn-helix domain-containing protein n=1 Tax=Streptomyces resistomycificus TaxID=67356 RepID=UPI00099B7A45|nr:helix-turn-helix domain-containing protein [Streptomyces resistomycificus]